jgi:hypothetical protein
VFTRQLLFVWRELGLAEGGASGGSGLELAWLRSRAENYATRAASRRPKSPGTIG